MSVSHKITRHDDGQVVVIEVAHDHEIAQSDFPHPLLTVDYNEAGEIIQFDILGPIVRECMQAYGEWLVAGDGTATTLLNEFVTKLG